MFKVGDRVRLTCKFARGTIGTIVDKPGPYSMAKWQEFFYVRRDPAGPTDCLRYHQSELEAITIIEPTKPHKHAALIKAWADGAQIQELFDGTWRNTFYPRWHDTTGYFRIKPEPKPDVVKTASVWQTEKGGIATSGYSEYPNAKFTFDGETGKLKAVEILG